MSPSTGSQTMRRHSRDQWAVSGTARSVGASAQAEEAGSSRGLQPMRCGVRRFWARAAALTASPARGCQPPAPPVLARCLAQLWFVHCDDKPLQVLSCPPPAPVPFQAAPFTLSLSLTWTSPLSTVSCKPSQGKKSIMMGTLLQGQVEKDLL